MRCALVLSVVLLVGFAPAPSPKHARLSDEIRSMQGEWTILTWMKRNKNSIAVHAFEYKLTPSMSRDRLTLNPNGPPSETWSISLHAGKVTVTDEQGKEMLGIYKLEGDRLTISYREPGEDRAETFTASGQWLLVLERREPRPAEPELTQ